MAKLLWILILATLACRLLLGRWPWRLAGWRRTTPEELRARSLLGLHKSATHGEIIDAHRQLIAQVHPDRGGTVEMVHEANAARDLLLSRLPATKEEHR